MFGQWQILRWLNENCPTWRHWPIPSADAHWAAFELHLDGRGCPDCRYGEKRAEGHYRMFCTHSFAAFTYGATKERPIAFIEVKLFFFDRQSPHDKEHQ